ncbi:magnesium-translocating P-type ATPase [Spiroplasma sp. DGKH1]|uniref:magnesium-translocating P-type ATPase n=1 Tax=Spiroplasma sp. DGKH1 TaxID=3050074 RepID=UPI0034C6D32D
MRAKKEMSNSVDNNLKTFYQDLSNTTSLVDLKNNLAVPAVGYQSSAVAAALAAQSSNVIKTKGFNFFKQIIFTFLNPFNLLLIFICLFNLTKYIIGNYQDNLDLASAIIVAVMMFLSAIISIVQDYKSFRTTKQLASLVTKTTAVIRDYDLGTHQITSLTIADLINRSIKIPVDNLLVGDLIYLSTGDIIPGDVKIIYANNFLVNQAVLNGESTPAYKTSTNNSEQAANIFDLNNICFMGTSVSAGSAIGVVIGTGKNTYLGSINQEIKTTKVTNSFNIGLVKITRLIILMILVMVPVVLVLNGIRTHEWLDALVLAMSVAVGLTPESLPMIVAANLTKGSKKLAKQKVVIKQLDAVQNLGAIDVLCTDKTGTLTEDKIILDRYYNYAMIKSPQVLKYAFLNSYFQTGMKNQIDEAIINYPQSRFITNLPLEYQLQGELPFDFTRRRMSVLMQEKTTQQQVLITKGAFEEILNISEYYFDKGLVKKLDRDTKIKLLDNALQLNQQGMRIIALAYQNYEGDQPLTLAAEQQLIFLGFLCFKDLIKKDVINTLKLLKKYGVETKILTGDSQQVTLAVCQQIGFQINGILDGEEIDNMTDQQLMEVLNKTNIFVKLTPFQKARIIELLQKKKHKVGFLGDGINDAIALRKSDVGISVANATDIAKEAADIILLEKSLLVLENGIIEGRRIFANIIKYIKVTVAANFGLMLSLVIASAWLAFAPMAPIQILFQNLLYDISQVAVVFDNVHPDFIKKPRGWNTKGLISFALWNGPSVTFISILNFIVSGIILSSIALASSLAPSVTNNHLISQFQTTMFTEGAILHMMMVMMMRTNKINIFKDAPPLKLVVPIAMILGVVLVLPYLPKISTWLQLTPPDPIWYAYLAGLLVIFIIISSLLKIGYLKIYKKWL